MRGELDGRRAPQRRVKLTEFNDWKDLGTDSILNKIFLEHFAKREVICEAKASTPPN